MSSNLFTFFIIIVIHLIVAGIILINISKRNKKQGLLTAGIIMLTLGPVFLLVAFILYSSVSSVGVLLLIFLAPIAILVGAIVAITYSIIFIANGFADHRPKKITAGFILLFGTLTVIVTPIVLISIFGLPIALM
ncbi:MAG: hypothetical protein J6N95_01690 [Bacilli bacterium]|nr:hypothetical protein [Bacilli bacterium]